MGIFSSDEEPMWSDVFALQDDLKRLQEENKKLKENQCCPETCKHIAAEIIRYSNVCEINLKYKQALEETLKSLCNSLQRQNILREIFQQSKFEQNERGNKSD